MVVWGVLDQTDPDAFSHVIATAVRELNEQLVYRLLPFLAGASSTGRRGDRALRERLLERTTLHHVETPLFSVFATLCATSFLATNWEQHWDRWHPSRERRWPTPPGHRVHWRAEISIG